MAKKLLIGLVVLLVLAVGAVFVVPSFIDWNQYKDRVAEAAEEALGRRLDVDGALSVSLLPLPTLVAEDVRLANLPEAGDAAMVRVEEVRVRVSLVALLGGAVQVESVRLVDPVVRLERLPSGRANWTFQPAVSAGSGSGRAVSGSVPADGTAPPARAAEDGAQALNLRLDSIEIVNGRVLYLDPAAGVEEEASDIEAVLSAQSLRGPFRGEGTLVARGLPVAFGAGLGALEADRAAPVSLTLSALEGAAEVSFSGLLTSGNSTRALRGDLEASGDRLPALMEAAGLPEPPPALARPFAVDASLAADLQQIALENLSLRLGDAEARGAVTVALAEAVPRVRVDLSTSAIDIEKWLTAGTTAPEPTPAAVPAAPDAGTETAEAAEPVEPAAPAPADGGDAFTLPRGVEVALDLRAEAVAWRGGVVRQTHLAAELVDGELTIHELTGQMPGSSSLAVFGFIGGSETAASPTLDLTVEARSDNLRAALDWAGVDVSAVPLGRLTLFQAEARLGGTLDQIRLRNLDAKVDTTTLRGAATIVPGARPAAGITLRVGSLNLDAYLPPTREGAARAAGAPAPGDAGAATGSAGTSETSEPAPLFAGLEALNAFDANFRVDVETLTWRGAPLRSVHLEGSLVGGTLSLRDSGVGQALGATVSLNGAVGGFGGVPTFDDFAYALAVPDPARVARGFSLDLPVAADSLGSVDARGTLNGPLRDLGLTSRTRVFGGVFAVDGAVKGLGAAPAALAFDLAVKATHPETRRLLTLAATGYRPRGPLGALALSSQVSGQAGVIAVSDLTVGIGEETLSGNATVDYTGVRPFIQADLTADRLTIDRFLPAEQQAMGGSPGLILAAAPGAQLAQVAARWSEEPLGLDALDALDLNATLRADALVYDAFILNGADVAATLKAGVLQVSRLTGTLFGGTLTAEGRLDGGADVPTLGTTIGLDGFQLGSLMAALDAGQGASGVGTLSLQATSEGASEATLVSRLDGQGAVTVDGLTVSRGAAGEGGGAALLGPILALNQLGALGGGAKAGALNSDFVIEDGIVRFQDLSLTSNLYSGAFTGTVNLPLWTVDISGQAKMSQNLLTQLLGQKVKLPDTVPVSISGSLEAPRVRVQTGRAAPTEDAPATETPAPPRTPEEAVPQILDQLLGGNQRQEEGADPAPADPKEQLLRGLMQQLQKR